MDKINTKFFIFSISEIRFEKIVDYPKVYITGLNINEAERITKTKTAQIAIFRRMNLEEVVGTLSLLTFTDDLQYRFINEDFLVAEIPSVSIKWISPKNNPDQIAEISFFQIFHLNDAMIVMAKGRNASASMFSREKLRLIPKGLFMCVHYK